MSRRPRAIRFEEAFDALATVAHRVAYRLLGDAEESEDVAQEALSRAYVRWGRVEPYAEPWVARVAANLALDRHRRRARARRNEAAVTSRAAVGPARSPRWPVWPAPGPWPWARWRWTGSSPSRWMWAD